MQDDDASLTPRQLEIFQLMSKGLSNREICALLDISSNTVKIHVAGIFRRLGVANRTEAVSLYQHILDGKTESPAHGADLRFVDRMGRPSIALLPFELVSAETADLQYLVRGIEEELLARLSAWQWFPVIALASARRASREETDPRAVGASLRARYVISGTLRADADQVRATIHLLESTQGSSLWSGVFDFRNEDLFATQTEVARQLIAALAPELIAAEVQLSRYRAKAEFTVWDNVCRGAWYMHRMTPADSMHAIKHFDAAIAQDDEFGLAYNGKVSTHQMRLYQQWSENRENTVQELLASARMALRLEPNASYAHSCAGLGHILLGDRDQALEHLQRAVALNPSSTTALNMLGQAYGMSGRLDECIMHMEDLLRVDPYSGSSYIYHNVLGMCHYQAQRYDEGIQWSESSLALNPQATGAYVSLIAAHVEAGNPDDAREAFDRLNQHAPDFELGALFDMMKNFTRPDMLERIRESVAQVGLS